MNEVQQQRRLRLKNDFLLYALNCLKIRTKDAGVQPLALNQAQRYIHERLEEQRARTGKVRAVILKGRQQGCSTYIEGRFMWRTTHERGLRAYILTHEDDATQNLFSMAKRYHEHLPQFVKPSTTAANAKELVFNLLDSGYQVGTAGNKAVGRSQTNQLFHGSEVAYWPNAAEHAKGVLQTVPDSDGTEVIYESTANGLNNFYHQQWKQAEAGVGDFIAIFVPWYWQDEYRKDESEVELTDDERTIANQFNLDAAQMCWRRQKIRDLSAGGADGQRSFRQEYPLNAAEAFQFTGEDGLITPAAVMRARNNEVQGSGALIVGADPAMGGNDRFSMTKRWGRKAFDLRSKSGADVDNLGKRVAFCREVLDEIDPIAGKKPDMMFIDAGNGGSDIVDRLKELEYTNVRPISFGSSTSKPKQYINKRGEMWGEMNLWLNDENLEVELPDSDELQADLCASPYDRDAHNRTVLWKKDRIKAKFGFSPDAGDSLALTFAEPVTDAHIIAVPVPTNRGWLSA